MTKKQKNTTDRAIKEREILNAATRAFEEATGFYIEILEVEPAGKIQPDAVLQIIAPEGKPKKFYAEVKGFITKATLGHIAGQIRRFKKPGMLIARYVAPPMAERLKELNLAFIDAAGNAYINDPLIFFLIIVLFRNIFQIGLTKSE